MKNDKKRIVILGGGYTGVLTAKKLAKKYKNPDEVEIKLINREPYHTMLSELHEVAANRVPENAIKIDLKKIMAHRNVEVVMDYVKSVDMENQKLVGIDSEYEYDYFVIATGSQPTFYGCKGADEQAYRLWSYDDAVILKNHILDMVQKASCETDAETRKALLTFVVIGCGFTGIEVVGELSEWTHRLAKDFNIDHKEFTVMAVDIIPRVLPNFKEKMIVKTEQRLEKMGIITRTGCAVKEIEYDYIEVGDNEKIPTYTAIWAAGVEGSSFALGLDAEKKGRNRIVTDEFLRLKGKENVFVGGDNTFYIPDGEEKPVPQMIEHAEHSASNIAHNISATLNNTKLKEYKPQFHGAMVCIGGKYGVAQIGTPKTQFVLSGFFAMFVKHFINMVYFIQVAGFNKVWSYLLHEVFHVEDGRSFTGAYFSKRSPNFWLVPLRLYVGAKWLIEGSTKMMQIFNDPNSVFLIPQKVADATSAASEAAASYGEAMPVPAFISSIVEWSMDLMFYNADGSFTFMAKLFQFTIVSAEIIVGLCLIGGLFTLLASLASIGISLMVWASGMAPYEMIMYVVAAIAIIGGGGSVFSIDYYLMPVLKKYWVKNKFVKKWYLYTD